MTPLVSIIIPVFNAENYIKATIESCLQQSYTNLEIILVNDGSSDSSETIIESFKDHRIQYYALRNNGPCYARNFGIKKADGALFQFLDADDILGEDKLQKQVAQYLEYGENYVYSGVMGNIIENQKALETDFEFYYTHLKVASYFRAMFSNFGKYYTTGIWLVPKKLIEKTHGWDQGVLLNNDGEYFSRLILLSKGVIFCPGSIFYYRRDVPQSISKKFNSKKIYESWLYSYRCYVESFKKALDEDTARELSRKALSVYYCNSYPNYPELLAQCKAEIKELGFKEPYAYGGVFFKQLSKVIGTEQALKIRTFKNSGKQLLTSLNS
ncbi:glycosyltransferase family 2 protein [Gillisia sp. Hel_I_29]|uniref:glycosyltransferase family 2 protein n=1 Tax=Gillisia sp. Hel_I_29 TaxID=1249975 RepID=UPI0005588D67|nr:glycosyltransferase family 2 protein [Gillisia sp. Hel_I_29]